MESAERRGLVAGHEELRRARRERDAAVLEARERPAVDDSRLERLEGELADGRLLAPEALHDGAADRLLAEAEERDEDAEPDDVFRALRARVPCELRERHGEPVRVRAEAEVLPGPRHGVRLVEEDDRVRRRLDLSLEAAEVGPGKDDEDVYGVPLFIDRVRTQPHHARGLAAPDLGSVRLGLDDVEPVARAGLGQDVAHGDDPVAAGPDHRDGEITSRHGAQGVPYGSRRPWCKRIMSG